MAPITIRRTSSIVPCTIAPAAAAWPPPPQQGTDSAGIQVAGVGAQGKLHMSVRGLLQSNAVLYAFNLADEGGDVVHVTLAGSHFINHRPGEEDQGSLPAIPQLHAGGEQTLQFQAPKSLGPEKLPVDGIGVEAALHQLSCGSMCLRIGVAVLKTSAIGGDGHIEGLADLRGNRGKLFNNFKNQLTTCGPFAVQAGLFGKKFLGGVVVDGQVHPVQIGLRRGRKQALGGNVN